jgi:hypothetical protein
MSPVNEYELALSEQAKLVAFYETEGGELQRYAVTLVTEDRGELRTVRLYDNAHGEPEMHRYTHAGEKMPATKANGATPSEAYNIALEAVARGFEGMIDGWLRN